MICVDYTDIVDMLIEKGVSVFCIEKELGGDIIVRNSRKLLLHDAVQEFILKRSVDEVGIIFFKPLFSLEKVIAETPLGKSRTIRSLNASPAVSSLLENKLNFVRMCKEHQIPHPPSRVEHLNNLHFDSLSQEFGERMVVQFERGWFGNRTFFLESESDLFSLRDQYSNRKVKVSQFIPGTTLTINAVVSESEVYQTYPFIQINDDMNEEVPLARMEGSTVGNVWTDLVPYFSTKTKDVVFDIGRITVKLATIARDLGYRGFFGLDFLVDEHARVYAQEMNPRFTASAQMITQLEQEVCGSSLLNEHYKSFGITINDTMIDDPYFFTKQLKGMRVISRNTEASQVIINHTPPNGVYVGGDQRIEFISSQYTVGGLTKDEFLLLTIGDGRSVSSNEQLFEIQSLEMFSEDVINHARTIKKEQF